MKRIERQKGALARFKVLPMQEWINDQLRKNRSSMNIGNGDAGYSDYVARKEQERAALINRTVSY